jgi:hypothetical protein
VRGGVDARSPRRTSSPCRRTRTPRRWRGRRGCCTGPSGEPSCGFTRQEQDVPRPLRAMPRLLCVSSTIALQGCPARPLAAVRVLRCYLLAARPTPQLVKEGVFAILAAAHSFQPPPPPAAATLSSVPENGPAAGPFAAAAAGPAGAAALPRTFAATLAHLIRHHSATHVDVAGLQPLAANPTCAALTGPMVSGKAQSHGHATLVYTLHWYSVYQYQSANEPAREAPAQANDVLHAQRAAQG